MNVISFFKEHLLIQALSVLTILMLLTIGPIVILNIRGQNAIIEDAIGKRYEVLLTSIEEILLNPEFAGDKKGIRDLFKGLQDRLPGVDIFLFDADQRIIMSGNPESEGKQTSQLVGDRVSSNIIPHLFEKEGSSIGSFYNTKNDLKYLYVFGSISIGFKCEACDDILKEGIYGIFIRASIEDDLAVIGKTHHRGYVIGLSGLIAIVLVFFLLFQNFINRPIHLLLEATGKLRKGDFTHAIEVSNRDEIGHICARMNLVSESLRGMIKEVLEITKVLALSTSDLNTISKDMSEGAMQTSEMADAVSASSEGVNLNIRSIADAIEQTLSNVNIVATSTEGMTATINEIAQNTDKARIIANKAVSQARGASENVDELGNAAKEIGKITETISKISEQTNLLALNATIEAARAGESGKSFAVVANEVKNLANQTTEATYDIEKQIEGIQGSTESTVFQIKQVLSVINDVNEIVTAIAAAVEEQSVTTKEIAKSVAQASVGIQDVNTNMGQSSILTQDMSESITEVNGSARGISNSSAHVQMSVEELSMLAEQLKNAVGKFKV